jgi:hypothetical protein
MTLPKASVSVALDHIAAIVGDLAVGAATWERLGFLLSPISRQRGKMPGRDDVDLWGTANRCAIFRQGYLELIGTVDRTSFNPWAVFLHRFEGLHLLALRVPDAGATYARLRERTRDIDAPVQRERELDVAGEKKMMKFRNIFSRDDAFPEGRYIFIEHQTPEYLWQPRYQTHPNGALALEAVLVCADDVLAQTVRLKTLLGSSRGDETGGSYVHTLAEGRIEIHPPSVFHERFGWTPPALPCFAGAEVRFSDRIDAAKLMEKNGVPVQRRGDDWYVFPAHTNGFVLKLVG